MKDILGNEISVGDWLIIAGNTGERRLELGKVEEITDSHIKCLSFIREYTGNGYSEKFINPIPNKYRKIYLKHPTAQPADFIKIDYEKIKDKIHFTGERKLP